MTHDDVALIVTGTQLRADRGIEFGGSGSGVGKMGCLLCPGMDP